MERKLEKFIDSLAVLADIRNLDPLNPVLIHLDQPVTGHRFIVAASIIEPSLAGVPVHTTWVVLDPQDPNYKKALRLDGVLPAGLYHGTWTEISTYDQIFEFPQYYPTLDGLNGPAGGDLTGDYPNPSIVHQPAIIPGVYNKATVTVNQKGIITEIAASAASVASVSISGPATWNTTAGSTQQYGVVLQMQDGTTAPAPASDVTWLTQPNISGIGIDSSGLMTATSTGSFTLSALVNTADGVRMAKLDVSVQHSVMVTSVTVSGPTTIFESTSGNYIATFHYSDGSSGAATGAQFSLSTPLAGTIGQASGLLTATTVTQDVPVVVTALDPQSGVSGTINVTIINKIPTTLTLHGPLTVDELSSGNYTATVTYNDGAQVNNVAAAFSTTSTDATVSPTGALTVGVIAANVTITVHATYTDQGVTVMGDLSVLLNKQGVRPYYGKASPTATINEALILALASRGPTASQVIGTPGISINTGANESMYFAYPVSYGLCYFVDTSNGFEGGWDGATRIPGNLGPTTINVTVNGTATPFYVYQADYPNLGATNWTTHA